MTYFPIDDLDPGRTVVLRVRVQNAHLDQFPAGSAVTVTRDADGKGFTYDSAKGATRADMTVAPNPGHQGLNAHLKALYGAPYAVESARESDLIRREYMRLRRGVISRARTIPAPFDSAARCLANARETVARCLATGKDVPGFYHSSIWRGLGGSDGATFAAHGESRMRWIENPAAKGLRLVGLAHDAAPAGHAYYRPAVEHSGWYLDNHGGETVAGVVYQLPGRDGRARYLVGYADPWNADAQGRGPACLSLDVIEGDPTATDYDPDPALRDVARHADAIAESFAESERDYQAAYRAGAEAAQLASDATEAAREWAQSVRGLRALWPDRAVILPNGVRVRDLIRNHIGETRDLCAAFRRTRKAARAARADAPARNFHLSDRDDPAFDGWQAGFADGAPV